MNFRKFIPAEVPAFYARFRVQLPIVGLLIVGTTFVAHDYFREDAKNLAESLNRAQEVFQMREEVHSQDSRIGQILNLLEPINHVLVPTDAIKKSAEEEKFIRFFRISFDMDETTQLDDEMQLLNIEDLLHHMRRQPALNIDFERVEKALKARKRLIDEQHEFLYLNTAVEINIISKLASQLGAQKIPMRFMPGLEPTNVSVPLAVGLLTNEVFYEAKRESIIAEATASFWKVASILLYLAGFALALGGKLFDVETLQADT